jgi:branched-chain amino acid transport system ATP-binding protein
MPMLTVDDVSVGYTAAAVIQGVTFSLGKGEVAAIIGPNGAGKSTTLRTISGLLRPWSGSILLDGQRADGLSPAELVRRGVAHVPEGRHIFPGLTVLENLGMGAYLDRDQRRVKARLDYVFELFEPLALRRRQTGASLSGGEQQMLAVGRALMSQPRVLLLDEPSIGLAPLLVARLLESLRRLQAEGLAIVLVEQNTKLALSLADHAYVLSLGHVVAHGTPDALRDSDAIRAAYLGGVPPA